MPTLITPKYSFMACELSWLLLATGRFYRFCTKIIFPEKYKNGPEPLRAGSWLERGRWVYNGGALSGSSRLGRQLNLESNYQLLLYVPPATPKSLAIAGAKAVGFFLADQAYSSMRRSACSENPVGES